MLHLQLCGVYHGAMTALDPTSVPAPADHAGHADAAPPTADAPIASPAAAALRAIGARVTPARVRVLTLLREAQAPLSHHDVETALGPDAGDRVTLYRVLDWLAEAGLATRGVDASRVTRYAAARDGQHQNHLHFHCDGCGQVYCLDTPPPPPPALPEGFQLQRAELDLHGQCQRCTSERD